MLYRKNLFEDPETGAEIRIVRYPAGVINTRHIHTCAHGMYVLEGTLVTHAGSFGPGHFVWFPAGTEMEHGATADADVTVLFITNRRFNVLARPAADRKTILEIPLDKRLSVYGTRLIPFRIVSTANSSPRLTL